MGLDKAVIELDTGMNLSVVEKIPERADEATVLKYHATRQEIEAAIRQSRAKTVLVIKKGCSDRSFFRNLSEKEGTETGEFRKCLQAVGIENEKADSFMSAFREYFFMPPEVEWQKYMREWVKEICPELMEQYLRAELEFMQSWKGCFEKSSHQDVVQ